MISTPSRLKILAWPAFKNRSQNPYNFLLSSALEREGVEVGECSTMAVLRERYAILHIHWPEGVWNTPALILAVAKGTMLLLWLLIAKVKGAKIVWTVHNLRPHEGYHPRVSKVFGGLVLRLIDGFIQLTGVGNREMRNLFPQTTAKRSFVIPHGHYRDLSPTTVSRAEAREALNVPPGSRVITFCGAIRRYKNVPALIDAFVEMAATGDRLLIAGKTEQAEVLEEIETRADGNPNIAILSKLLSEFEIEQYVRASDLVVLPYNNILNSGAAILALSYGRPVLVPALGAMLELQRMVGVEWVTTYEGELNAAVLATALAGACNRDEAASPDLSQLDWDRIARLTVAAYSALIEGKGDSEPERAGESPGLGADPVSSIEPLQSTHRRASPRSVVFVDQYASVSGGQRSLIALMKVALAAGHEVSVMAPLGGALGELLGKTFGDTITLRDIPEARLTSDRKRWYDYAKYLAYTLRFLSQWRFLAKHEIIYVNGSRTFLPCHLIARALVRRFIFHVRLDHKTAEKRLISMIASSPRTFRVVSNSEYNTAQLHAFDGRLITCERLVTVENALYPPYDSLPLRNRFADVRQGLTFGIFGRVSPEKGHNLIPALAQKFSQSRFVFIGHCDPENREFLNAIVAQCPGNCEYAGFRSDLPEAVEEFGIQISLVPSLWNESFGLVAIESMAMSCLTVVSNTGMLPRLAERTGALVFSQPEELLALSERLHGMTPAELSALIAAQHRATLHHFGFERFAREINSLLAA